MLAACASAPQQRGANREVFLAAHGDFARAATRAQPMLQLAAGWVPEGEVRHEPGDFELQHYLFDATVPIPLGRDSFLVTGAHAGARRYEFSAAVPGASDEVLVNAGLRIGYGTFVDDDLVVQGYWQPSLYSDLDGTLNHRDWKLWYGAALAVKRMSPTWFWKAGLALTDAVDTGVIPVGGFAWLPAQRWRVDVLLPQYVQVSHDPHPAWTLHAGLELRSEEFHVRSPVAQGRLERDIHVQDLRAVVGALHRLDEHASVFARIGSNVTGHYDWSYAPEPDYDGSLEPALFVEFGVGWSF
jgi:hypothetical protein